MSLESEFRKDNIGTWQDCPSCKTKIAQEIFKKVEKKPDCWVCEYFDRDECEIVQHPIETKGCLWWQQLKSEYKE